MKPGSFARFGWLAVLTLAASSGCSGDDNSGGQRQTSLTSTCDQICNNVVAQCGVSPAVHQDCLNGCQTLQAADVGCADELAAYLACLGGATSVQCQAGGQYVLVSPPGCAAQQQAYATCHGGATPLAACFAEPLSASVCSNTSGHPHAYLCVGAPLGCVSPTGGTIVLGTYCCP